MLISRIIRRMFSIPGKTYLGGIAVLLILSGYTLYSVTEQANRKHAQLEQHSGILENRTISHVHIEKVEDGDTLIVSFRGRSERLRLIGVDTPEIYNEGKRKRDARRLGMSEAEVVRKGRRASQFVKDLITEHDENRPVRLELGVEERDKYGRLLGYIWFEDGTMLNKEIIRAGYGPAMVIPPNSKYYRRFKQLEREAKAKKRGIWKWD